jgi:hypothetical protein
VSNSTRSSSSSASGYDERYVVPLEASRRGAHRARVSPIVAALPVAAVVGIVVGAMALVYVFLGGLGHGGDTVTTAQSSSPAASSVSAAPTSSASPADGAGTAGSSSPSPSLDGGGPVDKTVSLAVYNGSGVSGLARKAADKLTADGWTVGTTANWAAGSIAETTVYYGADAQKPGALAIVKLLGRGTAKLSAAKAGAAGLAVVVGRDYPTTAGAGGAASPTRIRSTPTKPAGSTRSSSPSPSAGATHKTTAPAAPTAPTDPAGGGTN